MAKRAKKLKAKKPAAKIDASLLSHPGLTSMMARVGSCNKPPIYWHKAADGSWMECFLRPDCTYGNCHEVSEDEVPPEIRDT